MSLFESLITQPLLNALIWFYNVVPGHDLGVAIILLTIAIRIVLWPLQQQSLKSQKAMQELQPKLAALKAQHGANKEAMARATMELYKQEKVNPFSSCLPLLIQLPVLFALYYVLQAGLKSEKFDLLYPFVANPGTIRTVAFGFLELAKASIPLAALAGLAQYWQSRMLYHKAPPQAPPGGAAKDEALLANVNKQMMYMMPVMTVVIGATLPAGLSLYWLVTTVLMGVQQVFVLKRQKTISN